MHLFPMLGLGLIATGYLAATDRMEARFAAMPAPEITAYDAGYDAGDPSVYDMLGHGAQPYDQPHCEAHAAMAANLTRDFAEQPVATQVTAAGLRMELWASEPMGSWTLVHKGDDGVSCVVSSGTGWTADTRAENVFAAALGEPAAAS